MSNLKSHIKETEELLEKAVNKKGGPHIFLLELKPEYTIDELIIQILMNEVVIMKAVEKFEELKTDEEIWREAFGI